jgi:hypothetical protein
MIHADEAEPPASPVQQVIRENAAGLPVVDSDQIVARRLGVR